ncbi:hypothetical protein ACTXT7_012924 [Hymenolepis weldensis]
MKFQDDPKCLSSKELNPFKFTFKHQDPCNRIVVYVPDHHPNNKWTEGIMRTRRGSVPYEVDVDGQTWVENGS